MNITASLIARIEEYRATNKHPCKNYATEAAAERVASSFAATLALHHDRSETNQQKPCRYVVVFNEAWGRWVIGFDLTELLSRSTSVGGYVGLAGDAGFFTF